MDRFARLMYALLAMVALAGLHATVVSPPTVSNDITAVFAGVILAISGVGLLCRRPPRPLGWWLMWSGVAALTLSRLFGGPSTILTSAQPWDGFLIAITALSSISYILIVMGLVYTTVQIKGLTSRLTVLDIAIVLTGLTVVMLTFLAEPLFQRTAVEPMGRFLVMAKVTSVLLVSTFAIRLWTSVRRRPPSLNLALVAVAVFVLNDVSTLALFHTPQSESLMILRGILLISATLALAFGLVHQSLASALPTPEDHEDAQSPVTFIGLTLGLSLPGVVTLVDGALDNRVLWPVVGIGSVILAILVGWRTKAVTKTLSAQATQLHALARSDGLTGAPNRRTWDHELARACDFAMSSLQPLAVAVLDLDRFKQFNDLHGHQAGDVLLKEAVIAWNRELAPGQMLARYGGEEFAVLLPNTRLPDALEIIERLRRATPQGQTLSAGIASWRTTDEGDETLRRADEALYSAKRNGRDRCVTFDSLEAGRNGIGMPEVAHVLQPVINIETGEVVGHEALTRFPRSQREVMDVFRHAHIDGHGDLLELHCIISAINLKDRPPHHRLFVNVSDNALLSERFWQGLPADLTGVVFEVSAADTYETDLRPLALVVDRVRERGGKIALDDIGAGGADLTRMVHVRPSVVKVDGSLVVGCAQDKHRRAVLRALVTYAHDFDIEMCGEGLESPDDFHCLRELGFQIAQGFLLAPPATHWHTAPIDVSGLVHRPSPPAITSPGPITAAVPPQTRPTASEGSDRGSADQSKASDRTKGTPGR